MRRVSSNDASEVIQLGDWIVLLWSCNASGPAVLPWMKDTMEAFQAVSFFSFITAGIFQEHGGIFFCCQLYLQMALYLSHHHWCHFAMWRIGVKILPWCAERASQGLPKRGTRNKHVGWWKTLCVCYSCSCIYIIVYQRNEKKKKKRFPCGNLNNKNFSIIHLCHYSYPPLHALPCGSTGFFRDGCVAGIPKCVNSTTYRIISSVPALLIEFIATWCMRYVCRLQFILVDVSFIWKQPCWQIWLCN